MILPAIALRMNVGVILVEQIIVCLFVLVQRKVTR